MRLQKFLASYGIASRRKIEEMITEGRIKVNGKMAELGCTVDPKDTILIDNVKFVIPAHLTNKSPADSQNSLILYHKPVGKICTNSDPQDRETVFSDLPIITNARWISIGRLDLNTSGLLLFTTDGTLANKLMHPSNNYEREYLVRVLGNVDSHTIKELLSGVMLEDGLAKFKSITLQKTNKPSNSSNNWYKVVLTEGRNRVVRRLFEAVDCRVSRLMRIRFGDYKLPRDLAPGSYVFIDKA